ncbi:hypothetical protein AMJ40_05950 [candidate division TA06 bacterium DG_26]|uniref:Response regulatory domain-containing protein n=1 Tax=candidate division TA06 bacterium DG_26 TaxID=1703771 RepID=A0A0S7WGG5_UNCT6|nr:MAG: hypothetical protein AMJ40_05950 [candidate division TA06 bacterium DG_26]
MDRSQSTAKVLIIDDDLDFVQWAREILERRSFAVDGAHNLEQAMDKLSREKPDLIVLDIMLEKLSDGLTICYRLKQDPELRDIPVFAISAISEKTGLRLGVKEGNRYFQPDAYAEKPISAAHLLHGIEKLLKKMEWKEGE